MKSGMFIISLDFELYWGERHCMDLENYKKTFGEPYPVVSSILGLFDKYGIHATWATVGCLFFSTRDELINALPGEKPAYLDKIFYPYDHIKNIGSNENEDPFHFAPSLIKKIASAPHQEIGTHTFSHYFCLENGQDVETFKEDLESAIKIAKKYGINIESLVFPLNQLNDKYLSISKELGIKAYRGNESFWIYRERPLRNERLLIRLLRLIDSYFNISGHNCYSMDEIEHKLPFNIPSSRLLRPYLNKLGFLEPLRLRRILSDLSYAAEKGLIYHLWWHPHDFGINLEKNISFLEKILRHYSDLRKTYGMESLNMRELVQKLQYR